MAKAKLELSLSKTRFEELVYIMGDIDIAKFASEDATENIKTNFAENLEESVVK